MISPSGRVIGRTGVSEQQVVQGPVELRGGKTIAVRVGNWPMIVIALGLIAGAHVLRRRAAPSPDHR
jgi:apolipoprotein N-acyltransferase